MIVWSTLRSTLGSLSTQRYVLNQNALKKIVAVHRPMSGGHGPRLMPITPSRWQWHKFKDLFHYYVMVGAIPLGILVLYCNLFIGPAQLAETPEGYVPKHWEYYKHPITRFLAQHFYPSHQQEYEKMLHYVYEQDEIRNLRVLEKRIKWFMAERRDYQAYYYRPAMGKYVRISKETFDELSELPGDH